MKKRWMILVAVCAILVVALIIWGYFVFVFSVKCSDNSCFSEKLTACSRTSFISENSDTIFQYNILGRSADKCKTNVKLLQIKSGTADLIMLEGKEMICYTDLGVLILPEKNLKNCHGLLKEEIQEIIIERLHTEIYNNLEEINNISKVI